MKIRREISVGQVTIPCIFRSSLRSRKIRITVYCGGRVIVTFPTRESIDHAVDFVREKSSWLAKTYVCLKKEANSTCKIKGNRKQYLELKEKALLLTEEKLKKYCDVYNAYPTKICIRNQKTRWGSCSRRGTLNINYRILFLPDHLVDYLIVHEICHLKEFNHSEDFWHLVSHAIPNYKKCRGEIRNLL